MKKLDDRDLKILSILQREGRIAKTTLAERVNLSPTPCWERLKKLEQLGIIEGYGAFISWAALGLKTIVLMEAEIESHQAKDFQRFEDAVQEYDEIMECWAVGGGLDYILKIAVQNVDEYQRLVEQLLSANVGLKRYFTYIVTQKVKCSHALPDTILQTIPD
jgi:Lrp/AsnC family transcriptional regulator of ectoine degradation